MKVREGCRDSPWHTHGNFPPAPPGRWSSRLELDKRHEDTETSVNGQNNEDQDVFPAPASPSPVTVVPQGQSSMAPWLWACSSTQGCWALRANSTDTLNLPSSRPPSDTVTRESGNTHSCSSAGSERSGSDFSWDTSLFHGEHLLFSAQCS